MNITPDLVDQTLLDLFADLGAVRHPVDLSLVELSWANTALRHTDLYSALRRLERRGQMAVDHAEQDRFLQLTTAGRRHVRPRHLVARLISRWRRYRFRVERQTRQGSHPDNRRRRTDVSAA